VVSLIYALLAAGSMWRDAAELRVSVAYAMKVLYSVTMRRFVLVPYLRFFLWVPRNASEAPVPAVPPARGVAMPVCQRKICRESGHGGQRKSARGIIFLHRVAGRQQGRQVKAGTVRVTGSEKVLRNGLPLSMLPSALWYGTFQQKKHVRFFRPQREACHAAALGMLFVLSEGRRDAEPRRQLAGSAAKARARCVCVGSGATMNDRMASAARRFCVLAARTTDQMPHTVAISFHRRSHAALLESTPPQVANIIYP